MNQRAFFNIFFCQLDSFLGQLLGWYGGRLGWMKGYRVDGSGAYRCRDVARARLAWQKWRADAQMCGNLVARLWYELCLKEASITVGIHITTLPTTYLKSNNYHENIFQWNLKKIIC